MIDWLIDWSWSRSSLLLFSANWIFCVSVWQKNQSELLISSRRSEENRSVPHSLLFYPHWFFFLSICSVSTVWCVQGQMEVSGADPNKTQQMDLDKYWFSPQSSSSSPPFNRDVTVCVCVCVCVYSRLSCYQLIVSCVLISCFRVRRCRQDRGAAEHFMRADSRVSSGRHRNMERRTSFYSTLFGGFTDEAWRSYRRR